MYQNTWRRGARSQVDYSLHHPNRKSLLAKTGSPGRVTVRLTAHIETDDRSRSHAYGTLRGHLSCMSLGGSRRTRSGPTLPRGERARTAQTGNRTHGPCDARRQCSPLRHRYYERHFLIIPSEIKRQSGLNCLQTPDHEAHSSQTLGEGRDLWSRPFGCRTGASGMPRRSDLVTTSVWTFSKQAIREKSDSFSPLHIRVLGRCGLVGLEARRSDLVNPDDTGLFWESRREEARVRSQMNVREQVQACAAREARRLHLIARDTAYVGAGPTDCGPIGRMDTDGVSWDEATIGETQECQGGGRTPEKGPPDTHTSPQEGGSRIVIGIMTSWCMRWKPGQHLSCVRYISWHWGFRRSPWGKGWVLGQVLQAGWAGRTCQWLRRTQRHVDDITAKHSAVWLLPYEPVGQRFNIHILNYSHFGPWNVSDGRYCPLWFCLPHNASCFYLLDLAHCNLSLYCNNCNSRSWTRHQVGYGAQLLTFLRVLLLVGVIYFDICI